MHEELENAIGYRFKNKALLATALIHSSYSNEHKREKTEDNERLEFLGDAALELSSSRYLFELFPKEPEGSLSKRRAAIVCEPSLAACARAIDLGNYLQLGKGEEKNGGRFRDSILSDAFEAVIGALFLDGGFDVAERFVRQFVMSRMTEHPVYDDAKTKLQEAVQGQQAEDISYLTVGETGPEHEKIFTVEVKIGGVTYGKGQGHSKKLAEQIAAAEALRVLQAGTDGKQ